MTENELKYGVKNKDVIAQLGAIKPIYAFVFCIGNILKYATRYNSQSEKAYNTADLDKINDYANRAFEFCETIQEPDVLLICDYAETAKHQHTQGDTEDANKTINKILQTAKALL